MEISIFFSAEGPRDTLRQLKSSQLLHSYSQNHLATGEWPWRSVKVIGIYRYLLLDRPSS